MKKSIYIKNFLSTAGIVLLSFLVLGSMFFVWSYQIVQREKQEVMSSTAGEVVKYLSALSNSFTVDANWLKFTVTGYSSMSGFDILITDEAGTVISCSDQRPVCEHLFKTVPKEILTQIRTTGSISKNTDLDGVYGEIRYVTGVPMKSTQGGYIFLSDYSDSIIEIWRKSAGVYLLASAIVLLLTFILSFITTKNQAKPINDMALAAERFARGDFSVRVEDKSRIDEIGQLTDAFNSMADSIERSENLRRDFIANVSHELKSPMTVISGFSDGLLDGTIPPETERKYLEVISSETKRLSRLVSNMLDMSRIQSTLPDTHLLGKFDIAEVIRLSLLSLSGKIEAKNLDVEAQLPEEAVITRGSKDAITQVVHNLIDNAVKFADNGSTLRLSLWKQGTKATVSVENSGGTIPAEEMPLIFDRFHKADRSRSENREGVGLGLYIVKTILNNHNEDIYVTSGFGVTKFTFTLTLASQ
jgi:signal transduction histidine kinase